MTAIKYLCYGLMGVYLIGCSTTQTKETGTPMVERLAPRDLSPGECGLFVWTGDADRRFILFSRAATFSGAWLKDQYEVPLKITEQDGTPANRQFPNVSYLSGNGTGMTLSLKNREPIINGTRFKGGTLRITEETGWETVKPVVGLTACQPT